MLPIMNMEDQLVNLKRIQIVIDFKVIVVQLRFLEHEYIECLRSIVVVS